MPYVDHTGSSLPIHFRHPDPKRGQPLDWSNFAGSVYFDNFRRTCESVSESIQLDHQAGTARQYVLQLAYVGSQGQPPACDYEVSPGSPQTCNAIAPSPSPIQRTCNRLAGAGDSDHCGAFGRIVPTSFSWNTIPAGASSSRTVQAGPTTLNAGTVVGSNGITLVGLRNTHLSLCDPMTGLQLPRHRCTVFSGIFSEDTIAHRTYNSLQAAI